MYYLCSENKGAEADLRLCFRICKKPVFLRCGSFNLDPLEHHFYKVKMGFTGFLYVCMILGDRKEIESQNIGCEGHCITLFQVGITTMLKLIPAVKMADITAK